MCVYFVLCSSVPPLPTNHLLFCIFAYACFGFPHLCIDRLIATVMWGDDAQRALSSSPSKFDKLSTEAETCFYHLCTSQERYSPFFSAWSRAAHPFWPWRTPPRSLGYLVEGPGARVVAQGDGGVGHRRRPLPPRRARMRARLESGQQRLGPRHLSDAPTAQGWRETLAAQRARAKGRVRNSLSAS